MAIGNPGLKAGAVTSAQRGFTILFAQHDLARYHDHEFILILVPVAQCGPRSRRQHNAVYTKLGQPAGITDALFLITGCFVQKAARIDRAQDHRHFGQIKFGRGALLLCERKSLSLF